MRCTVVLALLAMVCVGARAMNVEEANAAGILLLGNGSDPADLDPQITTGQPEANIHAALFEGLVRLDGQTLEPLPGVAEHWEVSEDERTYTFHLRPEARWSNGESVTANDFRFAYQRILNPALGAEYAHNLFLLVNARAFHEGKLANFNEVGVRVANAYTLVLELEHPTPYLLSLLAHPSWFPMHPPTLKRFGAETQRGTRWTRPGNLVSNGPFMLSKWVVGDRVEVVKNPNYWDADHMRLNGVQFLSIENQYTEERAFRGSQLHATAGIPLTRVRAYLERHDPDLHLDPDLGVYYYLLNVQHPPLDDPRLRHALSLALDRALIAHQIRQRGELPAFHFTPPGIGAYKPPDILREDADEARRLLAEAGYPDGKGFPTLTLLYNTSDTHRPIAEAVQQMWKSVLGIDVELVNQEWKVYLESRREQDFAIARAGWLGDYYDPTTFLDLWTSTSGNNHSGWTNFTYDSLLKEAATTSNPAERNACFARAETLLLDQLPVIPLFFYNRAYLKRFELHGWHPNLLNNHPYQELWLQP